ncbi:hypothetical protein O7626_03130 [Micromonospora sp. WMMD1102]|uniref:hypothetical protein n=1 Tax=Micromonospora sp. WMMD1102 TaxID=3016105 RepID=UPI0024154913|nr:hypothetical protein [Micromonospora sp. WMMD1102]MDG4784934.1 hypothetical protein [Micromonospora sp. WMMD1102]
MSDPPVTRDTVAAHLPTYHPDAYWPTPPDLATRTAAAWNEARTIAADDRHRAGADAVVDAVFPLGYAAARRAGVEAVADHITAATREAVTRLSNDTDPGRIVRGLLGRLTAAAHDEVRRHAGPAADDGRNRPSPRTYFVAASDNRANTDAQRAAAAAGVAWTHGIQDGWGQAYWAANRIIIAIRDSELSATSAIDGIPAVAWLDDLADAARAIADERPGQHPVRLARLAGPTEAPPVASGDPASREAPSAAQNHHNNGLDKDDRRPRGM